MKKPILVPAVLLICVALIATWMLLPPSSESTDRAAAEAPAADGKRVVRPTGSPGPEETGKVAESPDAPAGSEKSGEVRGFVESPLHRLERPAPPSSGFAEATVRLDGEVLERGMTPDEHGTYPRIVLPPDAEVDVALRFPEGGGGEEVVVQAHDGGSCPGSGGKVDLVAVSDAGIASFKLRMESNSGIYRFSIRHGSVARDLDFWVGEIPSLAP